MDSNAAQRMKAAWAALKESKPTTLSEINNDMIGMEQAMGAYATEAIDEYRRHLIGIGFDWVSVQKLRSVAKAGEEMGREFSSVIAFIHEFYAADIAAAKRRAGDTRPSDETLAK